MSDSDLMDDIAELENSFASDVANILRESWTDLTAELKQDLINFELGILDFDTLYSKYWNEDGSWKDQLAGLDGMFKGVGLNDRNTATENNAESETSASSSSNDGYSQADAMEASDDNTMMSNEGDDVEMDMDIG